jgi:hypothetical protein
MFEEFSLIDLFSRKFGFRFTERMYENRRRRIDAKTLLRIVKIMLLYFATIVIVATICFVIVCLFRMIYL